MSKWIRKGDQVLIRAGNDKGKAGEVLAREGDRVLVQGVNIRKKHMKRTEKSQGARIVEMEVPIHVSNVALCDKDKKILKVKVREAKEGRELVYKAGNKVHLYRPVKKPA